MLGAARHHGLAWLLFGQVNLGSWQWLPIDQSGLHMNFNELEPVTAPQRQPTEIAARLLVSLPVFTRSPATRQSLAWAKTEQVPWRTVMSVPLVDAMGVVAAIETVDAINTPGTASALCFSSPATLSDALMRVMFPASGTSKPYASQAEIEIESDAERCAQFLSGIEILECFTDPPTSDLLGPIGRDS
jgi:hypothetical protein